MKFRVSWNGRVGGLALQAIGLGWIALLAAPDLDFAALVAASILTGIGSSMAIAATANAVVGAVASEAVGKAAGANGLLRELGGVFGVALAERLERLRAIADAEQRPLAALAPRIRLAATERPLGADRAPGEGTLDQICSDLAALETLGPAWVILDPFVPRAGGHAARLTAVERMAAKIIEL